MRLVRLLMTCLCITSVPLLRATDEEIAALEAEIARQDAYIANSQDAKRQLEAAYSELIRQPKNAAYSEFIKQYAGSANPHDIVGSSPEELFSQWRQSTENQRLLDYVHRTAESAKTLRELQQNDPTNLDLRAQYLREFLVYKRFQRQLYEARMTFFREQTESLFADFVALQIEVAENLARTIVENLVDEIITKLTGVVLNIQQGKYKSVADIPSALWDFVTDLIGEIPFMIIQDGVKEAVISDFIRLYRVPRFIALYWYDTFALGSGSGKWADSQAKKVQLRLVLQNATTVLKAVETDRVAKTIRGPILKHFLNHDSAFQRQYRAAYKVSKSHARNWAKSVANAQAKAYVTTHGEAMLDQIGETVGFAKDVFDTAAVFGSLYQNYFGESRVAELQQRQVATTYHDILEHLNRLPRLYSEPLQLDAVAAELAKNRITEANYPESYQAFMLLAVNYTSDLPQIMVALDWLNERDPVFNGKLSKQQVRTAREQHQRNVDGNVVTTTPSPSAATVDDSETDDSGTDADRSAVHAETPVPLESDADAPVNSTASVLVDIPDDDAIEALLNKWNRIAEMAGQDTPIYTALAADYVAFWKTRLPTEAQRSRAYWRAVSSENSVKAQQTALHDLKAQANVLYQIVDQHTGKTAEELGIPVTSRVSPGSGIDRNRLRALGYRYVRGSAGALYGKAYYEVQPAAGGPPKCCLMIPVFTKPADGFDDSRKRQSVTGQNFVKFERAKQTPELYMYYFDWHGALREMTVPVTLEFGEKSLPPIRTINLPLTPPSEMQPFRRARIEAATGTVYFKKNGPAKRPVSEILVTVKILTRDAQAVEVAFGNRKTTSRRARYTTARWLGGVKKPDYPADTTWVKAKSSSGDNEWVLKQSFSPEDYLEQFGMPELQPDEDAQTIGQEERLGRLWAWAALRVISKDGYHGENRRSISVRPPLTTIIRAAAADDIDTPDTNTTTTTVFGEENFARKQQDLEVNAFIAGSQFYTRFKQRYESGDIDDLLDLIDEKWESSDGSDRNDLEERLMGMADVYEELQVDIKNLKVEPSQKYPNMLKARYSISITGRLQEVNDITHVEEGEVTDILKPHEQSYRIFKTAGTAFAR